RKTIFVGSLNASIVHRREIFREAVKRSAASIVCAHNHPSGDPSPSQEDIHVTRRLVEAGKIIGIELLDHLVIGNHRSTSLKEKGYLYNERVYELLVSILHIYSNATFYSF